MRNSSRVGRRPLILVAGAVLIATVAGGGYGLWYLFLRPTGPAPVDIAKLSVAPSPAPSAAGAAASGPTAASPGEPSVATGGSPSGDGSSASSASSASTSGRTGIAGTWTVNTTIGDFSSFTSSFVGYRVQEQLATIGANTAVGRTPNVSGSMTIQGTEVTAAKVTADLTALQSDDSHRDGALSRQGLETATYPTATFELSQPIELGSVPPEGQTITVTATGQLTLHGQTRTVQIQLAAKRSSGAIVVTGSLPIVFADYDITKPRSFAVLTIADQGTMELQLFFTPS